MKAKHVLLGFALSGLSFALAAEHVDISQLPDPVKNALSTSDPTAKVKQVTIRSVDGRTIYDVELDRENAVNARFRIASDGTVIRNPQPVSEEDWARSAAIASSGESGAPFYIPRVNFEDLPRNAQETVTKKAAGRQISSITTDTLNGRKGYLVTFKERGSNPRLVVGEDGTILRPEEKQPPFAGTVFSDVPAPVQETIRREIGDGQIINIDKKGLLAEPRAYTVDIRTREGTFQLRIVEDGTITHDSRKGVGPPKTK